MNSIFILSISRFARRVLHQFERNTHKFLDSYKNTTVRREYKLVLYVLSLYSIFVTWGYLQEKIATTSYHNGEKSGKWDYPMVLNFFAALSASATASSVELLIMKVPQSPSLRSSKKKNNHKNFLAYWRLALASAVASPIGYFSLKFVTYPMLVLSKSSKHVPVMFIGKIFYQKVYEFYKYCSVFMICFGILLFTSTATSRHNNSGTVAVAAPTPTMIGFLIGISLLLLNLVLDGIISNEQDSVFQKYSPSSIEMMKHSNRWQAIYFALFLLVEYLTRSHQNVQLIRALSMIYEFPMVAVDIAIFCFCVSIGQILILSLVREFGSLVWITVSVTRQLFTVLLSVFLFKHQIGLSQWIGIFCVFVGLGTEIVGNYMTKRDSIKDLVAVTRSSSSDIESVPFVLEKPKDD